MTTLGYDLSASTFQDLNDLRNLLDVVAVLADYYQVDIETTIDVHVHAHGSDPRLLEHIRLLLAGAGAILVATPAGAAALGAAAPWAPPPPEPDLDDPAAWEDIPGELDPTVDAGKAAAGDPAAAAEQLAVTGLANAIITSASLASAPTDYRPDPCCPDCGARVTAPGRRCRTCAGKERAGKPRSANQQSAISNHLVAIRPARP